jgi:hypothetical protein
MTMSRRHGVGSDNAVLGTNIQAVLIAKTIPTHRTAGNSVISLPGFSDLSSAPTGQPASGRLKTSAFKAMPTTWYGTRGIRLGNETLNPFNYIIIVLIH